MAGGPHSDSHNHPEEQNLLIPLSCFEGGHLLVKFPTGNYRLDKEGLRGSVQPVTLPFLKFDADNRHLILPRSRRRLILGTYHIKEAWKLRPRAPLAGGAP